MWKPSASAVIRTSPGVAEVKQNCACRPVASTIAVGGVGVAAEPLVGVAVNAKEPPLPADTVAITQYVWPTVAVPFAGVTVTVAAAAADAVTKTNTVPSKTTSGPANLRLLIASSPRALRCPGSHRP
jgi:hypothetical protein